MLKGLLFLEFLFFAFHSFGQTYLISDGGTVSTCSGDFYDNGGSGGNYGNNRNDIITFCSSNGGQMVVDFTDFRTRDANDYLRIYDGPTTSDPLLNTLSGDRGSGAGTYTSSGTCLTFWFVSNGNQTQRGWTANLSCIGVDPCFGLPVLTFDPIANVCEDDAAFDLTEASPSGGIYSGTGITTSPEFDPSVAGAGIHTITYTYTDINGCTGSIVQIIEVVALPTFGYKYATSLTLDAASGSEDLTDFPVLVQVNSAPTTDNLRTVSNGGHVENANGYDIVFTNENYSQLDHQIESYDPTTGVYNAWVRIPLLSSSSPTTIYMTYGNAGISSDPSTTNVWISSYKGVWHLNNDAIDATITGNDGAESNTSDISGVIGGGKSFNGSNSYIQFNPLTGMTANDENQSLSIWAQYASVPGDSRNFFSIQNPGSAVQIGFRGGSAVAWKWGGTLLANAGFAPSTGAWHYFVYTFDGITHHLFIDGIDVGSSTAAPQVLIPTEGNLGRYNNGEYFNGWLDEARYSLSPLSSGWISTEYSNLSNPSDFVSYSSERQTIDTISVGVCITSYTLEDGYPSGGAYSGTSVSGTNFNPSVAGIGTHTLTYTYSAGACTGASDTKVFIVTPLPSAPVASDVACCSSNILDLIATGTNLNWYSDAGLTTNVGFGSPFATGQTTTGSYTYYVTQTVNGCESVATEVTLSILNTTLGGTLTSTTPVCVGESTFAELTGYSGNVIEYDYSSVSSTGPWTTISHPYDTLTYGPVSSDIWLRALVKAGTCPQTYSSVAAVVNSIPSVAPTSASSDRTNICPNDGNIVLSYSGGTLGTGATAEWYSDAAFTTNVGIGNNLTVATPASSTTYYVRFEGECNNTSAQSILVTIGDAIPPTFTAPADITIYSDASCAYDASVGVTGDVTDEADNCSVGDATYVDAIDSTDPCIRVITRTWSLVDDNGNAAEDQDQIIVVSDNIAPVIAVPPMDVTVQCATDLPVMIGLAWTDNCDGTGVVAGSDVSDGLTCPETIIRTWTYTDACGNSASVSQTITNDDDTNPTASNPAAINVQCAAAVPAPNPNVVTDEADNCTAAPVVAFVSDVSDGNTCPEVITRTYSVTDDCGNSINVTQTITINDVTPPTAVCQNITVQLDATGNATITTAEIDNGSSDNCSIASMSLDISSFDCTNLGANSVTLTVEDGCGNQSACTATVTVVDNLAPIITCPADINVLADTSYCGDEVTWILPIATDNCPGTVLTSTHNPGDFFPVGTTTVSYTATDASGLTDVCSFDVVVGSAAVPVITGATTVCTPVQEMYSAVDPGSHAFLWSVSNGTIIGSATNTSVTVEWTGTSQGNLDLSIISGSGCISTNNISVDKNAAPNVGIINSNNKLTRR